MRKFYSLVLFIFTVLLSQAQAPAGTKITGLVKDADGKALNAVTVSLLRSKDSSLAKLAVSDKNGNYEFLNIKEGNYLLSASSVGFGKYYSATINVTEGATVEVPAISLAPSAKDMANVTVTSRRPLVETRMDKMIVNVDASPTNAGSSALDVLERSPGIMVDKDGNISLKGKQGVIVLIDNKPTYLGGADLANYLRNLSASQLDQIEIMTQPSAKYDASGNSGILNIRTKKNVQMGFNGGVNLSYVQGRYPKSPNSFNFNYRKGKVNLFTNMGYSYWEGFSELNFTRRFHDAVRNVDTSIVQRSDMRFHSQNFNLRVGMDYSIDKKTSVGFSVNGVYNPREHRGQTVSNLLDENKQLLSINEAFSGANDKWTNFGGNINFRKLLNKPGKEWTADVDYVRYSSSSNQFSNNYSYDEFKNAVGIPYLLKGELEQNISIYSAKTDYVVPMGKDAKFEAGLKSSIVRTDNDAPYVSFNQTDNEWRADARSDHFIYEENINAGYVNYSKQVKKFGFQAGLRVEHTHSLAHSVKLNKKIPNDYIQPFPTAYISYKANEKNSLGLSYGRRLDRPNYQDMNPFQQILDQYTYRAGNPYLTPQFTHNVELTHNFRSRLNTTINYTYTDDIINDILKQNDSSRVTFQTKENIAKRRSIGVAVSYNAPVTKWWNTSMYVNAFNNHFEGFVNGKPLNVDATAIMANMNQQFRFKKGWGAEVSGFIRSKTQEGGIIIAKPMGVVSFGASKQILKTKGTLKLNVTDPFRLQKFSGYTKFGNIDMEINNLWDNRRVGLTFSYRFSKGQNAQPQRRKTGASQEEQNRIGASQQ